MANSKIEQLIKAFKEVKEDLNKTVNQSYSQQPNATTGTSGGQGGMYRSEGIDKGDSIGQDMLAMSVDVIKFDNNGQWKLDKVDPQENVNISHPKTKAKMMRKDEGVAVEKESKKEKVSGKPYDGTDSKIHKGDFPATGTNDENTGPGRHQAFGI